jgi:hypothetical protein
MGFWSDLFSLAAGTYSDESASYSDDVNDDIDYDDSYNDRPKLNGDRHFQKRCNDAMDLLQRRDPENYRHVCDRLKSVSSVRSGGSFVSGGRWDVMDSTLEQWDDVDLAGTLVHEATHSRGWGNSQREELECLARQAEALRNLGYDSKAARIEEYDGTHYQDKNVGSW